MARQVLTDEEKAGKKIADVISDLRLDATRVGESLGTEHVDILNRLVVMIDGMYAARERFRQRLGHEPTQVIKLPQIVDSVPSPFDVEGGTPFMTRCEILAEVYTNFKTDERFASLVEQADIGYPSAYLVANLMVEPNVKLAIFIDEAWDDLLASLGEADEVWGSLSEVLGYDYEDEDEEDDEDEE